jgi:hypothetical protein
LAGIIISPFFWLRFLKKEGIKRYIQASSLATLVFFILYYAFVYNFISNLTAKVNADLYYLFYDVLDFAGYIVFFLVLISPFIFTKIIYKKFSIKSFILSLLFTLIIFIAYAFVFAYIIFPMAGEVLLKNI